VGKAAKVTCLDWKVTYLLLISGLADDRAALLGLDHQRNATKYVIAEISTLIRINIGRVPSRYLVNALFSQQP
jgi:hypothetical protein